MPPYTELTTILYAAYPAILIFVICLLLPPMRHLMKKVAELPKKDETGKGKWYGRYINFAVYYEEYLHLLVIFRYVLLFFLPIWLAIATLGVDFAYNQLLTLTVMGGSIVAFLAAEFPKVMKAHLRVTFAAKTVDEEDYSKDQKVLDLFRSSEVEFERGKITLIAVALYNLGFSTYKDATVLVYFGKGFKVISTDNYEFKHRYENLDFHKQFSIQERHGGAAFSPEDIRFHSFPPKEVLVFPIFLRLVSEVDRDYITIQFSSEGSWGMTTIKKPFKISNGKSIGRKSPRDSFKLRVRQLIEFGDW